MKASSVLDRRPVIMAIAGPNGAGKTTFYRSHLADAGLRFVNADVIARELSLDPYGAARAADALRRELVRQRESFIFETVLSDPVGDKVEFLGACAEAGYNVVLCFIGLPDAQTSKDRVAMRVLQGGHDVPSEKLDLRFARTLKNLERAITRLPVVYVFDNGDIRRPFRRLAVFESGKLAFVAKRLPQWLLPLVK